MTDSTSPLKTQAQNLFGQGVVAAMRQVEKNLEKMTEGCESDASVARAFGLPEPQSDVDKELVPIRIALKQISSFMALGFSMEPEKIIANGGGAPREIRIERSAEGQLTHFFKHIDSKLLNDTLSQPGMVESLQDETHLIRLYAYPDQSVIANSQKSRIGASLFSTLCDRAERLEQVAMPNDTRKDPAEMRKNMDEMRENMARDAGIKEQTRKALPAIFERAMIDIAKMADETNELSLAYENCASFMASTERFQNGSNEWASGVKVALDGVSCPTPKSLAEGLGVLPPLTLSSAIERLRQSREPSPSQEPSPAAPKQSF